MQDKQWSPQHSPRKVEPSQLFSEALSWFSYCALGHIFPGESLGIQGIPQNPRSPRLLLTGFSVISQGMTPDIRSSPGAAVHFGSVCGFGVTF